MNRLEFENRALELTPALYRIALSILRQDADARDAVQLALLKAWEKRDRIEPEKFRAYVSRIAVNVCRDEQRRRMRISPVETLPERPDLSPDYRELYEALQELPEHLRLCAVLKYLQGYSEQEAAQTLKIPVSTFRNRLHRARKALRKMLDREVTFE